MAKQPSYQPKVNTKMEGLCFKDTKPAKVDPKKEQFAPTPAAPMRQRFKMAGGC